jgi:hypothetical protein
LHASASGTAGGCCISLCNQTLGSWWE